MRQVINRSRSDNLPTNQWIKQQTHVFKYTYTSHSSDSSILTCMHEVSQRNSQRQTKILATMDQDDNADKNDASEATSSKAHLEKQPWKRQCLRMDERFVDYGKDQSMHKNEIGKQIKWIFLISRSEFTNSQMFTSSSQRAPSHFTSILLRAPAPHFLTPPGPPAPFVGPHLQTVPSG